jgi:hypothetical protein
MSSRTLNNENLVWNRGAARYLVNVLSPFLGVGVWIDVVKLTPGDDIRRVVRTIAHRVSRVVIFLSPAYVTSPNCAVEFIQAIQAPHKCLVCVVEAVDPSILAFVTSLGIPIVHGLHSLILTLDEELQDMQDQNAVRWWREQQVSSAGVPGNIVPTGWPMARFSISGKLQVPSSALTVGPCYLTGDCSESGTRVSLPWLLLMACAAVGINCWVRTNTKIPTGHSRTDWIQAGGCPNWLKRVVPVLFSCVIIRRSLRICMSR